VNPETRSTIRRVGIVLKPGLAAAAHELASIERWLEERGIDPVFELETPGLIGSRHRQLVSRDELPQSVDLLLVLGGDGTLLGMADRVAQAGLEIPILGVNFGSLGFLTDAGQEDLYPSLEAAVAGTATIELRMMLRARAERHGSALYDRAVLNDVVVTGGALSRIVEFSVWVGSELVARFLADGIIIASPTGSTAYNLSAGGPIVHPAVDALILNPIAPHTLTHRPVVIPASANVKVEPLLKSASEPAYATFDGQLGLELQAGDVVCVRKAERPVHLVRTSPRGYYEVLRRKLKWAER
jgi:NAD+ kinase